MTPSTLSITHTQRLYIRILGGENIRIVYVWGWWLHTYENGDGLVGGDMEIWYV